MVRGLVVAVVLGSVGAVAAREPVLVVKVEPGKLLPKGTAVVFVEPGGPGPGAKGHQPVASLTKFDEELGLHSEAHDVWLAPKHGRAVRVAEKWEPGKVRATLDLSTRYGILFVRGDDFPRAGRVVVTPLKDAGPGEKGHAPVQVAGDYKEDMLVPVGTYEVWVVPANGARPQRVADNVRVLNARTTEVPER